ncbi:MAG: hypothetical protein K9M98_10710 [Cephaloticoccus sp.]|nr:hypothetical protein [Cephaloticoccus sp.]MCF7760962.1 hypothetical protein [Cephaloticoccus sp.]
MIGASAREKPPVDLTSVWGYAADNQPIEARVALKKLDDLDERSRALAGAVLDMARPPLAEGDWNEIEPVLERLAAGDDPIAAQAQYLRARMYQVHRSVPDYVRAEQLYRELARRWPGSHWAQLGYVKLGLAKLFALPEPRDARVRLQQVAALLTEIQEPTLRRDLQLQMGWAGLFHDLPLDEVLPHLIAAEAVGGMMGITPEDLTIQIGELSFRAGHLAQAKLYFEKFLEIYPSNTRRFNVRQRLQQVLDALAHKGEAP